MTNREKHTGVVMFTMYLNLHSNVHLLPKTGHLWLLLGGKKAFEKKLIYHLSKTRILWLGRGMPSVVALTKCVFEWKKISKLGGKV